MNWGRIQADGVSGSSEFWRQAIIGDTLTRSTGDTLSSGELSFLSGLVPELEIQRVGVSGASMAISGRLPSVLPESNFHTAPRVDPFYVDVGALAERAESPTMDTHLQERAFGWNSPWYSQNSGFGSALAWQATQLAVAAQAAGATKWEVVRSGDTYPDRSDGDSKECVSLWQNTFSHDGRGHWVPGRELAGCRPEENKKCPQQKPLCRVKADKSGCECGPSVENPPYGEYDCCCCVKSVKVKKKPNPKSEEHFQDAKGRWRVGNQFIVEAELTHDGNSGKICPCTMTWAEWANQSYDSPSGEHRALPKEHWNLLPDAKWSKEYGSQTTGRCEDRTVTFTIDRPGPALSSEGGRWEIWIEVCVRSCVEADCKCKEKRKCARLHQVVRQTSKDTATPTMEINDNNGETDDDGDKNYSDKFDPPTVGWRSDQ